MGYDYTKFAQCCANTEFVDFEAEREKIEVKENSEILNFIQNKEDNCNNQLDKKNSLKSTSISDNTDLLIPRKYISDIELSEIQFTKEGLLNFYNK